MHSSNDSMHELQTNSNYTKPNHEEWSCWQLIDIGKSQFLLVVLPLVGQPHSSGRPLISMNTQTTQIELDR